MSKTVNVRCHIQQLCCTLHEFVRRLSINCGVQVWNGRLAMVAFASLIAVETIKAGPGLVP